MRPSVQADAHTLGSASGSTGLRPPPPQTYAPSFLPWPWGLPPAPVTVFPSVSAHSTQGWSPAAFLVLLIAALSSQDFSFALRQPSLLSKDSQEFLQQKVDGNPGGKKDSVLQADFIMDGLLILKEQWHLKQHIFQSKRKGSFTGGSFFFLIRCAVLQFNICVHYREIPDTISATIHHHATDPLYPFCPLSPPHIDGS